MWFISHHQHARGLTTLHDATQKNFHDMWCAFIRFSSIMIILKSTCSQCETTYGFGSISPCHLGLWTCDHGFPPCHRPPPCHHPAIMGLPPWNSMSPLPHHYHVTLTSCTKNYSNFPKFQNFPNLSKMHNFKISTMATMKLWN